MIKTKSLRRQLSLLMNVLVLSSKELGSTEANLETFKRDAGITDLTSDAQIAFDR